jgi:thiol-disulfide isomerase/thioredoxin
MSTWVRVRDAYRNRRLVRWSVDALALVAVLVVAGLWQTRHHVRGEAPAFSFPLLDTGAQVSRSDLVGKPTMLVFWAPWCTVCKAESQNVSWVRSVVGARANVLSVVSGYQSPAEVQAFVRDHAVDYPVLLGDESTSAQFAVEAFPTVYFLDAQGHVSGSAVGYSTTAGLLLRLLVAGLNP